MSIQTPTTRAIVFDIETIPQDEAKLLASLPPFDPAEVKVGNLKDADKIAAKIAEAEAKHKARWLSEAALSPVTGRVAMIGSMESIDGLTMATSIFYLQKDTITEETLLAGFWGYWESTLREEYTPGEAIIQFQDFTGDWNPDNHLSPYQYIKITSLSI